MRRPIAGSWSLLVAVLALSGCGTEVVDRVIFVDRSGCLACHRPIQPDGSEAGIERAHPLVDGQELSCQDCHGGDPDARKQSEAHVKPAPGAPAFIKNLSTGELDEVSADYLRFINPGDYRVTAMTCGAGSPASKGSGCHQELVEVVKTSQMATFSGELGVARYRAGEQRSGAGIKAIKDVRDPDFRAGAEPGTVGALEAMEAPTIMPGSTEIGPYQDLYLTKACMRCHTWSFGDNKFPGDFRSSGCSACHMVYSDDGLSRSADPTIDKDRTPHPVQHVLTRAIPVEQCGHCHYRGGRIGPSYQGYRESGGVGFNPPSPEVLGVSLHGHDASFYLTDEDSTNDFDETPPDVHFEAGLACIDCHTPRDVHGDGRLYVDGENAVEIECEDCHGGAEAEATFTTRRGTVLSHLERDTEGNVWLRGKLSGKRHPVSQIKRLIDNAAPGSFLHASMGRDGQGFSHLDKLECYTCHSAWVPTCFGCHVTVDMSKTQRSLIDGAETPGNVTGGRRWAETDILLLMLNTEGRVSPSMPAERMFFNAIGADGSTIIDKAVRVGPDGSPGNGQRAFPPHTVRRTSPFMACQVCHPIAGTGQNMEALMQTLGFGSTQFIEEDGQGTPWAQDRIMNEAYGTEVLVGHDDPNKSGPLPAEMIERMLQVEVPAP